MRCSIFNIFFICILLTISSGCQKEKPPTPISEAITISIETDPQTLDPRQARNLETATAIHMLYEGLTRLDQDGNPSFAIAESVSISPDQKTYSFAIRESGWSNGKKVKAQDFEKSWKSVLDPHFPAPNAYQLYVIKGAKAAKEGKIPLDEVGITAIDDETLVVELERPVPYFLHLTATYFYYPVSEEMRHKDLAAEKINAENLVTNGPFKLQSWTRQNELVAETNQYYWYAPGIQLDKITFVVVDNPTALAMFDRQELDWTGSPLSTIPTDAILSLKSQNRLEIGPAAGVYLFRLNTEKAPFDQKKLRQALSLAINREDLVEYVLQGNQIPTQRLVPPSFMKGDAHQEKNQLAMAQKLFKEALNEKEIRKDQLSSITLCYANSERTHKIAQVVQQQWKENLGLEVQLQSCEKKVFFEHLKNHDYQIAIGNWFADFRDPISFLDVFKYKNNGTNNTQWENPRYIELLELSSVEANSTKRTALLKEAEDIIVDETPIIPLFFSSHNYLKHPGLKGVYFSELGYLDFKQAYLEK